MPFVPIAALMFLNKKLVDWIKEFLPNNIPNKLVQAIAFVVGVVLVVLFAASDWSDGIVVGDKHLGSISGAGLVIIGLLIGAGGGVLNDAIERRNPDANPDGPPVPPAV